MIKTNNNKVAPSFPPHYSSKKYSLHQFSQNFWIKIDQVVTEIKISSQICDKNISSVPNSRQKY